MRLRVGGLGGLSRVLLVCSGLVERRCCSCYCWGTKSTARKSGV